MTVISTNEYTHESKRLSAFLHGMRDCTVIASGYFIVSFTLGIAMRQAGMSALQGFFCSLLNNASAGEYAGITLISSNAAYGETALMTMIVNARYLLMSCSLSQKISPDTPFIHRLFIGFDVTDELFGLAITQKSYLNPWYYYGAISLAMPAWAGGTLLGILTGSVMSASLISAFSVALYAMFLAIIIPEGKKNKAAGIVIILGFLLSYLCSVIPVLNTLSDSLRTIILTVLLSGAAAVLAPHAEEEHA